MKRVLALVLAAMLLINLSGCMYGGGYRGHSGGDSDRRSGDHDRRGGDHDRRGGDHDRRH
ncbi:MAG: hypothetical protein WAO71_02065 [Gallionella sp.]